MEVASFDARTEIGVLGISAAQGSSGLPIWSILVFPALFTAGMALVDTTDSVLMLAAYGWAFVNPLRKLWYNLTITAASVLVALLIGGIEALGLLGDQLAPCKDSRARDCPVAGHPCLAGVAPAAVLAAIEELEPLGRDRDRAHHAQPARAVPRVQGVQEGRR